MTIHERIVAQRWRSAVFVAFVTLSRIKKDRTVSAEPFGAVKEGVCGVLLLLRAQLSRLDSCLGGDMNMLSIMSPKSTCGGSMDDKELLQEWRLELNPPDAHIEIRCSTKAQCEEYAKRLFPKSYVREHQDGTSYIHFNETEKDNNNANGLITKMSIPNRWVTNRRLQDRQKQVA